MGSLRVTRIQVTNTAPMKATPLGGLLAKIQLRYSGAPSTADIVIKADGDTLFTFSNSNTNRTLYPYVNYAESDGSAATGTTLPTVNQASLHLSDGDSDTVVYADFFYYE